MMYSTEDGVCVCVCGINIRVEESAVCIVPPCVHWRVTPVHGQAASHGNHGDEEGQYSRYKYLSVVVHVSSVNRRIPDRLTPV